MFLPHTSTPTLTHTYSYDTHIYTHTDTHMFLPHTHFHTHTHPHILLWHAHLQPHSPTHVSTTHTLSHPHSPTHTPMTHTSTTTHTHMFLPHTHFHTHSHPHILLPSNSPTLIHTYIYHTHIHRMLIDGSWVLWRTKDNTSTNVPVLKQPPFERTSFTSLSAWCSTQQGDTVLDLALAERNRKCLRMLCWCKAGIEWSRAS